MRSIIHKDKYGNIIEDLSKVKIPIDLSKSIFEILNPGLNTFISDEVKKQKKNKLD